MPLNMFDNVVWPTGCIYNVDSKAQGNCEGGADIEHHFTVEGKKNVWVQKRKKKVEQAIMEYAEWAATRCSGSD